MTLSGWMGPSWRPGRRRRASGRKTAPAMAMARTGTTRSARTKRMRARRIPESRLYRKAAGREAKLCYMGHVTMENRHGLAVAGMVTTAGGRAERSAAHAMLKAQRKAIGHRLTAGADKAYDTR